MTTANEWDSPPRPVTAKKQVTSSPRLEVVPDTEEEITREAKIQKQKRQIQALEEQLTIAWKMIRERDAEIENIRKQTQPWDR